MARKKKAAVGDVIELKGNVVIVYPDGSTVTGRRSFTPTRAGTYTVHDGNTGEVIATYGVTAPEPDDVEPDAEPAPETTGTDEGQTDASAPSDSAPVDDRAGA